MAQPPQIRIDREALNELELYLCEEMLYMIADQVNALTKAGPIYGQILLPPEEAERKRRMMEGGDNVQPQ